MLSVIDKRRAVVASLKSQEVAESKLATFRLQFDQNGKRFSEVMRQDGLVLQTTLANRAEIEQHIADVIALQADEVLASFETDDAARHWRTRRGGRWGYMHELQTRVANRIFPKVAAELGKQTEAFSDFVEKFRTHLKMLSADATEAIARLEIEEELQFDIEANLDASLKDTLESLQQLVEGEETKIIALLEEFVDEQVNEKITSARDSVAGILGRGTTAAQTDEIRSFYGEVRTILKEALKDHVRKRFADFARHLTAQANAVPDKTLSEVETQIERTAVNIRAAAEAAVTGQKEAFQRISADLASAISIARTEISAFLTEESGEKVQGKSNEGIQAVPAAGALPGSTLVSIQTRAIRCVERHILENGQKGWSWSRVFPPNYSQGATEGWLVDPYLSARHQRRNLREVAMELLKGAKLKTLTIITREVSVAGLDADKLYFDALDRDMFEKTGMRVVYELDQKIHDRSLVLNNGIMFKLGRGLDIYRPVTGLAVHDPSLREVQSCHIDVFRAKAA